MVALIPQPPLHAAKVSGARQVHYWYLHLFPRQALHLVLIAPFLVSAGALGDGREPLRNVRIDTCENFSLRLPNSLQIQFSHEYLWPF
jgi:hypothetical protein